jgi:hypothetical protein
MTGVWSSKEAHRALWGIAGGRASAPSAGLLFWLIFCFLVQASYTLEACWLATQAGRCSTTGKHLLLTGSDHRPWLRGARAPTPVLI